jgi:carboxypeptidase Taq
MNALDTFRSLARECHLIHTSASVLGWDQETYMPTDAGLFRAEQLSWLSARAHELATSTRWQDALERALAEVSEEQLFLRKDLREMKRRFDMATKLPVELVARETRASSLAKRVWAEARQAADFSGFLPHLSDLVEINREKAELWGYSSEPYDALLSCYERGSSTAQLSEEFDALRPELTTIASVAAECSQARCRPLPAGPYPIPEQRAFNEKVARDLGYSFAAGRIDTTTHPFCTTLGPRDVRLTTRYDVDDFCSSLFGVLHEAGHGMYEQGLSDLYPGMASCDAVSLGVHESQSRLWENHVGRSRAFWEKWYPVACEHFPQLRGHSLDDLMTHIHAVNFSAIRVESDEATYDLHILLRFELERGMFRGDFDLADLPAVWDEHFQQLLGFRPESVAQGCLQDIHWSMGAFGYFPTYTLGNLNASQLMKAACRDEALARAVSEADYAPLLSWMRDRIHRHGALEDPATLIQNATGQKPRAFDHLDHLRQRYLG